MTYITGTDIVAQQALDIDALKDLLGKEW